MCRPVRVNLLAERWKYLMHEKPDELEDFERSIYTETRGKNPVINDITLKLNKRKLTEQELDEIIGKFNSERLATNKVHVS